MIPFSIPSPTSGVLYLGSFPLRAYSLFIIIGIFLAIWLGNKRWISRGGKPGQVSDVAIFAVPFGIIGGRIYHVATDWEKYFGPNQNWVDAFKIWNGGLGIWGAIFFGGIGAWIGCKYYGIKLPPFADAIAPGIIFAQAIGRLGNYFNQELFGRPLDTSWGLEIAEKYRPVGFENFETFHPTFLYELIWNVLIGFALIFLDRKFKIGHGRLFALYVAFYSVGRLFIENLRIDEARLLLGVRFNVLTSLLVIIGGLVYFIISQKMKPGIEKDLTRSVKK
ncbi:MAG: prolipoprotein diacylglyceryl transferase [Candidatus Nanopelagicales bacterium]|nr:prolipoprotein diacylglyceryl transferase [Candidatus Nanopelagicales bacterium]